MKKHKFIKRKSIISLLMAIAMVFAMVPAQPAAAATRKCYTIPNTNTTVYTSSNFTTKRGTIYPTDELTVNTVTSSYCVVTYPTSSGSKSGYIPTNKILLGTTGKSYTAKGSMTTYRRASTSNTYGSISKGDSVMVLGTSGSYTQVKYPVSAGYKYAFITTANAQKYLYGTSTGTSSNTSFQWPLANYYVCGNGWSTYYSKKGGDHLGVDILSKSGNNNVYATAKGTVVSAGYNSANGNTITIKHTISGKTVYSFYAHLASIKVSKGATVSKGQVIGIVGNTGSSSTGKHLHFAFTTQCSTGTWGYGPTFSNSSNTASKSGYTFYNPSYIIKYGKLP